jgi:hypothetical protein
MRFSICKVIVVMMVTSMLFVGKAGWAEAQEKAPDLRMLLNLDLFSTQPSGSSNSPSGSIDSSQPNLSMLDQIRALDAMGYLGGAARNQLPANLAPGDNTGSLPNPADNGAVPPL